MKRYTQRMNMKYFTSKINKMHKALHKYLKVKRNHNLFDKVKTRFEKDGPIAHNWDHIYRDTLNAIWIGEQEKANMEIIFPAILLHDIGFLYSPDPTIPHTLGTQKCFEWLKDWLPEEQDQISSCIRAHKGKTLDYDIEPKTLEEKIVCDADIIEKFGFIGVLTSILTMTEFSQSWKPELKSLHSIMQFLDQKISKLDPKLYTKAAKALVKTRNKQITKTFFSDAVKELEVYYT